MFPVSAANFIVVSMYWDQIFMYLLKLNQFNPHSYLMQYLLSIYLGWL